MQELLAFTYGQHLLLSFLATEQDSQQVLIKQTGLDPSVYVLLYMLYFPLAAKPLTKICSRCNHEMNYSTFEIEALEFSA
jgi:hypothetical protein